MTARVSGLIVTVADCVAVTGGTALSVAVTLIVTVPFAVYIVVKLAPVPDAGLPPVAVHAKVIGGVPPVAEAVQFTGVLTVPVVGHVITRLIPTALITTVADALAVFAFASVIVRLTVNVPAVLYIVVKLEVVPEAGVPPVAVHA